MFVRQMSVGQMFVVQMSVGQMSVGQMSVGQMSVSQMSFDKPRDQEPEWHLCPNHFNTRDSKLLNYSTFIA